MAPWISVIVCTYNRSDWLLQALETLVNQSIDHDQYEVIVIDNNSTDSTADQVKILCNQYTNLRYCFESTQGLSHARNRGWKEAKGEYVAYTDDDCKLPSEWLMTACKIIESINPPIFGGPFFPFYASHKPTWFMDKYGSYSEGESAYFLEEGHLCGGNLFVKRDILQDFHGFKTNLGMTGNKIGLGEESELVERVRNCLGSKSVYYDPELYVYHLVSPEKYKISYQMKRSFLTGRNIYDIFDTMHSETPKSNIFWIRELTKVLASLIHKASFGILLRNREKYPYMANYTYEVISRTFIGAGRVYEHYHRKFLKN